MPEMISPTVRIRVSGSMSEGRAESLAEFMNRMVGLEGNAPRNPFCALPMDQEQPDKAWAVFIRNNAIRAL